jgi:FlaA1/EpsC-like NDP-sugar epimerase
VLLAMPKISRQTRNKILSRIRSARVSVRTLPSVTELAQGRVSVNDLRELDIDDLLGREAVIPDTSLLTKNISTKVILVTGAGGSIGSELCRQILAIGPEKLLLVDQSEFALYQIFQELEGAITDKRAMPTNLIPLLASVQDKTRMGEIMSRWRPDTIYHVAAYKHVPIVEQNPVEGIKNNVIGTLRTAQAAEENSVSDFVLVSTDKAVRPTNIMGASKRIAEQVLQALSQRSEKTKFSIVRFGNVLGSSGSVVPKFRQQIRDGGPISLTHKEITRFFMTAQEAAQLVIQAGAMSKGGEVFLLDMGEPVRILDLARRMVELRPGEKLFEELLIGLDSEKTAHPRIMRAREEFIGWKQLLPKLDRLETELNSGNILTLRELMLELVPEYTPTKNIADLMYADQNQDDLK